MLFVGDDAREAVRYDTMKPGLALGGDGDDGELTTLVL
jgi:hypothetical protein